MIRSSFAVMLLMCVVCSFCGKDFVTLGRHMWRCKHRVIQAEPKRNDNIARQLPVIHSPTTGPANSQVVKCCCGKNCKGVRGLKMHQRSCKVVLGLDDELRHDIEEQFTENFESVDLHEYPTNDTFDDDNFPDLKKGIKLPKNDDEWSTANDFFKIALHSDEPIRSTDTNLKIKLLNEIVYNYFSDTCGVVMEFCDGNLVAKYKDCSVKELKKVLKDLKSSNDVNVAEVKFVSRTLRDRLRKLASNSTDDNEQDRNINHDAYISKSFWGYIKKVLNKKDSVLPSFNMAECTTYFRKTLSSILPNKLFIIPNWIPSLSAPEIPFDLNPPTYDQVTNVIRKIKASGSPCPLNQLSIICFKRCPFLRTYLTDIIRDAWSSKCVPTEWKKACTILIHKKGNTDIPSNFRPITLQSVPLKVFTSCLRNSIFRFLKVNDFIEHDIQKGFTPGLSGTLEHTAQMANIINKARIKQRSLVITLLDLKNAFGEVHHNLIQSVLEYHHVPHHIKTLIKSLYTDFKTSIITSEFNTPFIAVGRGVLQGDCLSPLLFNMCFNTFIQHIKSDKYRQLGFSFNTTGLFLTPLHWFQFADDAAVISGQESENQYLLNRFSIWCQWADMCIRVDKCSTFGIKKSLTKSQQYLPKLLINKHLVPCVEIGESFRYLGRHFDFEMSNETHKSELITTIKDMMSDIELKPLHPKNKLLLYSHYVLSKISWHFTVADISKTWITENLDPIVLQYVRKWLDVPISGTLSNTFLPTNKFGLNLCPPSVKFTQCQTVLRKALKMSQNRSVNDLWKSTNCYTNLQYDAYKSTKDVIKEFHTNHEQRLQNHLLSQGFFFSSVIKYSLTKVNKIWSTAQSKLPKNIFNFTIRYINNTLPTLKNLAKWGLSSSHECTFCLNPETLGHVVAGCKNYLDEGRYTWRHDSILNFLAKSLKSVNHSSLYADLPDFRSPSIITDDEYRPDLLLVKPNGLLYVLELTVGFESNLQNNIERKKAKYEVLFKNLKHQFKNVIFVNLSVSALGVFANDSSSFITMLDDLGVDDKFKKYIVRSIVKIAIRTTYYIFCCKNKTWTNPELMKYC